MRKKCVLISVSICLMLGALNSNAQDCHLTVTAGVLGGTSLADSATICKGYSKQLSATASGGTPAYVYSWNPALGLSNVFSQTPIASPSVTTTYTVTVTDAHGCTATASTKVIVDNPVVSPDSLLQEYLTGRPLTATGGTAPYTYTFSPAISTASLAALLTSTVTITYTVTVSDADGCSNSYSAIFQPLQNNESASCTTPFIDQYIQDTALGTSDGEDDAIGIYSPGSATNLSDGFYLAGTTNGSLYAPPFIIPLHGNIAAYHTFLIADKHSDTALTNHAGMLSDSLTFDGKDIVALLHITISPPNVVQCMPLDMVGAISPRPADSGWVVSGTGSTKNHTLIRLSTVEQGTMNWSVCENQWRVYRQGEFEGIQHYENSCSIGDPDLTLSFANVTTTCNNPDYLEFDVMVSSDTDTWFDNCLIWLSYDTNTFGSYIVTNGNVIITAYPNFSPPTYVDPQSNIADVGYDTLAIAFGTDPSQNSWSRTQITPTPQQMLHVKIKVKGCNSSSLAALDASFMQIFATYTLNQNDSILDALNYNNVYFSGSIDYSPCTMNITNYTNPINAGTNAKSVPPVPSIPDNSSILTITGSGFNSTKGIIKVSDANSGGANIVPLDSMDILSWSDNLIKVKMPDIIFNNLGVTPGSGPFTIYNACGDSVSRNIQINYNIENYYSNYEKLRPDIVMGSDTASITFRCDTSVSNNPGAYACVKKAIREWNCATGINWKLGPPIISDTSAPDGVSVIYFGNNGYFQSPDAIMQTYPWYLSCHNGMDSVDFKDESDTKIKRENYIDIRHPGYYWSYDTTTNILSNNAIPFYDVILHELGHAHGLNHINDPSSLMYWLTRTGYYRLGIDSGSTYPGPASLLGGLDMVKTSATYSPIYCNDSILKPIAIACPDATAGTPDISKNGYNLNLYPNPISNGDLSIAYQLTANSYIQFKIVDCTGRVIMRLNDEHKTAGDYSEQVNIDALAQGIYLFTAIINGERQTIKFIKI